MCVEFGPHTELKLRKKRGHILRKRVMTMMSDVFGFGLGLGLGLGSHYSMKNRKKRKKKKTYPMYIEGECGRA